MHVRVCLLGAFVPLQLVACSPDVMYALGGTFNWHFHKGLQFVITDVRGPLSSLSMWWTRCYFFLHVAGWVLFRGSILVREKKARIACDVL